MNDQINFSSVSQIQTLDSTNDRKQMPLWLEQVRNIGSVVCNRMDAHEDRIIASESREHDLSSLIHNQVIPWAQSINNRVFTLSDSLSLLYENLPTYLMDLSSQLTILNDNLTNEARLRSAIQESLQQLVSASHFESFRSQTLDSLNQRFSELISNKSLDLAYDDFIPKSDFLQLKDAVETELQQIKGDLEDLTFADPNPIILDNSLLERINNLIEPRIKSFQAVLESNCSLAQRLQECQSSIENLEIRLNKLETQVTQLSQSRSTCSCLEKLEDSIEDKFNDLFKSRFIEFEQSLDIKLIKLINKQAHNPTQLEANIHLPNNGFSSTSSTVNKFDAATQTIECISESDPTFSSYSLDHQFKSLYEDIQRVKACQNKQLEALEKQSKLCNEEIDGLRIYFDQCCDRISANHVIDMYDLKSHIQQFEPLLPLKDSLSWRHPSLAPTSTQLNNVDPSTLKSDYSRRLSFQSNFTNRKYRTFRIYLPKFAPEEIKHSLFEQATSRLQESGWLVLSQKPNSSL